MLEESIPSTYDEIDADEPTGLIIRNVIEFRLLSKTGSPVAMEDLGKSESPAVLLGTVIEPLPEALRQRMNAMMCSCTQDIPDESELAKLLPMAKRKKRQQDVLPYGGDDAQFPMDDVGPETQIDIVVGDSSSSSSSSSSNTGDTALVENVVKIQNALTPSKLPPFDRMQLSLGAEIDSYCIKTCRWYEAKVVAVRDDDMLRIHFSGWNSKYDEWIRRDSDRLAARGSSSSIVIAAAKQASTMVPWWKSSELYARAKEKLSDAEAAALSSERRRLSVRIEGIEDWCIDYTYPNPSLWLIASSGVWYRVAGAAMAGLGGHLGAPAVSYEPMFNKTRKAFLSCVHVAMILLDFLPSTPKMTLPFVVDEVTARSEGEVDECDILENYILIAEQMSNLERPVDWGPKVPPFASCSFITQLRKEGKAFFTAGGRPAMMALKGKVGAGIGDAVGEGDGRKGRKRKASLSDTKKQSAMSTTTAAFRSHPLSATLGEEKDGGGDESNQPPAVRTLEEMKLKYPMDDTKYWELVLSFGGENPLPPLPHVPSQEEDTAMEDGNHEYLPSEQQLKPLSTNPQQLGRLLGVWTSINNFRSFVSRKVLGSMYITLEAMEASLAEQRYPPSPPNCIIPCPNILYIHPTCPFYRKYHLILSSTLYPPTPLPHHILPLHALPLHPVLSLPYISTSSSQPTSNPRPTHPLPTHPHVVFLQSIGASTATRATCVHAGCSVVEYGQRRVEVVAICYTSLADRDYHLLLIFSILVLFHFLFLRNVHGPFGRYLHRPRVF